MRIMTTSNYDTYINDELKPSRAQSFLLSLLVIILKGQCIIKQCRLYKWKMEK